eukprot:1190399-Amphidinium_carterae.1
MLARSISPHSGHSKFRNQIGLTGQQEPRPRGRKQTMQAHASRSHRRMLKQAGFPSLLIPVRAMEHNVFQIFDVLAWKAECARSSCHTPPRA